MAVLPPPNPTRFTHHVFYDQPGSRIALAVCGYIMARQESVTDPTCPVCRAMLAEHERKLLAQLQESP